MLKITELNKTYQRDGKVALQDINLSVKHGEFTALLGQNGAGKTTLINILGGNVKKTSGKVSIGGFDLDKNELDTKKMIGIVPQESGYDFVFTVDEVLKKQMGYFGLRYDKNYIDELLESLSLVEKRTSTIRELSGGMKKRIFIAKALVHRPKILILDEPTAGVDIEMRQSMYEFLKKLHKEGTTIILTTHYIEEAEKLCSRIIVINQGIILADEPKNELMNKFSKEVKITLYFDQKIKQVDIVFLARYSPRIEHVTELVLKVPQNELAQVLHMIVSNNMHFIDINIQKDKLEDVYLHLISK
ncbi:MAG: ABC transporter ATP-binding protein [Eubacteriales bacterium]